MWRSLGLEDKKTRWSCRLNLAPWVLCSMGALLAVGCKYNKPCANGQCAPGQMNAWQGNCLLLSDFCDPKKFINKISVYST